MLKIENHARVTFVEVKNIIGKEKMRTFVGLLVWTLMLPFKLVFVPVHIFIIIICAAMVLCARTMWYVRNNGPKYNSFQWHLHGTMIIPKEICYNVFMWPYPAKKLDYMDKEYDWDHFHKY